MPQDRDELFQFVPRPGRPTPILEDYFRMVAPRSGHSPYQKDDDKSKEAATEEVWDELGDFA